MPKISIFRTGVRLPSSPPKLSLHEPLGERSQFFLRGLCLVLNLIKSGRILPLYGKILFLGYNADKRCVMVVIELIEYIKNLETRKELISYFSLKGIPSEHYRKLTNNVPSKLYRYCSLNEYSLSNLKRGEITFTAPELFNDIYDSTIHRNSFPYVEKRMETLNLMSNALGYEKIDINMDYLKKDFAQRDRHYMTYMTSPMRIGCFSEDEKSILMWSHYGDMNRGICIEYDFSKSSSISEMLYPVIYLENPIDMSDLCENPKDKDIEKSVLLSAITKSDLWQYEKEWRGLFYMITPKPLPKRLPLINMPKPTKIFLGKHFLEYWQEKVEYDLFKEFCEYIKKENIKLETMHNEILSYNLISKPISVDAIY